MMLFNGGLEGFKSKQLLVFTGYFLLVVLVIANHFAVWLDVVIPWLVSGDAHSLEPAVIDTAKSLNDDVTLSVVLVTLQAQLLGPEVKVKADLRVSVVDGHVNKVTGSRTEDYFASVVTETIIVRAVGLGYSVDKTCQPVIILRFHIIAVLGFHLSFTLSFENYEVKVSTIEYDAFVCAMSVPRVIGYEPVAVFVTVVYGAVVIGLSVNCR